MDIVVFFFLMFFWEFDYLFWILVEKYILYLILNFFYDKFSGNMFFIRWNWMSLMFDIYSRYFKIKVWIIFWLVFFFFVLFIIKIFFFDFFWILYLIFLIFVFFVFYKFYYINYKFFYCYFFVIFLLFIFI